MKRTILLSMMIFSFLLISAMEYVPNELIIKTKKNQKVLDNKFKDKKLNQLMQSKNAVSVSALTSKKDNQYYVIRFDKNSNLSQIKKEASAMKEIDLVQYNYLNVFHRTPNDPLYTSQQTVAGVIKLPFAWANNIGSAQVLVGVVDSGIDFSHPDLQQNIYKNTAEIPNNGIDDDGNGYIDDYQGWDFVDAPNMDGLGDYLDRDNDASDENYHGTHVSGIIGADTNNGIGIAGTAWNVRILPIRAGFRTEDDGYLEDDDAAAGIIYAADMGCNVINISWGDSNYSPIIEDACNYAISKGAIIVASAGNTPGPVCSYPARLNNVIAVGAVTNAEQLASFSSYGIDLDVVAPGQEIFSTYGGNSQYSHLSGTSMAAPFVTGAVALLLSQNPSLDYQQVRARLHASAKDLGDKGFDNKFGAGLLDVEKLLKLPSAHTIIVNNPEDRAYLNDAFDVFGTIDSPNFFRYSLMYTNKANPNTTDWKDILTHQNTPNFVYYVKHDELLGHFHLPAIFPDGEYRIRIRIENKDGQTFDSYKTIFIDRKMPLYKENTFFVQERWNDDRLTHVALFAFNKFVQVSLSGQLYDANNSPINDVFTVHSTLPDSIFSLRLPNNIGSGKLSVKLEATDFAGNSFATEWMRNVYTIQEREIDSYGFVEQEIGGGYTFARNTYDFDRNGKKEIIAMETGEEINGVVHALEYQNGIFVKKHTFPEKYNPLYLGSTYSNRTNLAGLSIERLDMYEGFGDHNYYPDLPFWSINNVAGAMLFDFTNRGKEDLIVSRNLADQNVIELYKREAMEFNKYSTIYNTAPTTQMRMFVPKMVGGNLDNDEYPDLLLADIEGNVMVYEWINSSPVRSWIGRIPVLNSYFLSIGDYTGDGKNEFLAGGYVKADTPDKSYWYFALFKNTEGPYGYDNNYSVIAEIAFSNVTKGQSSIASADIDGDGKTEAILALTPNAYVIKYKNGKLEPIWFGKSDKSFQIQAIDEAAHSVGGFFINRQVGDELKCLFVKKDIPFTGPNSPKLLNAKALDRETVNLSWQSPATDSINIYRKLSINGDIELINTVQANTYMDTGLLADSCYYYAVTTLDHNYTPHESHYSSWVAVTTGEQSVLQDAKMLNQNLLILRFDSPLDLASLNRGNFIAKIEGNSINPSSISCMAGDKYVLLHFLNGLNTNNDFLLSYSGIKAASGIEISGQEVTISYQLDTTPPTIKKVELLTYNEIEVTFSELLATSSLNNFSHNFTIESPFAGLQIIVENAVLQDSVITLTLSNNLINTIKPYWVRMDNVFDLAGNKIQNNDLRHCLYLTEITNLSFVETYPNPLRLKDIKEVTFVNLPVKDSGEIMIYNLAGELVYNHKLSNCSEFAWDGKNNSQKAVASGIYTYLIKMGNDYKKGKLVLIK